MNACLEHLGVECSATCPGRDRPKPKQTARSPKGTPHYSGSKAYKIDEQGCWWCWTEGRWLASTQPESSTLVDVEPEPWNGEGLPPEGLVVECRTTSGHYIGAPKSSWIKCKLLCATRAYVILRRLGETFAINHEVVHERALVEFRPIPVVTPRDKAIREMVAHFGVECPTDDQYEVVGKLYDAGYRKAPDLEGLATRLAGMLRPVGGRINISYKDAIQRVLREVLG